MRTSSGPFRFAAKGGWALALVTAVALAGCQSIYRNHGYVPTDLELSEVQVGTSTREDVATMIGRPSSSGLLEGSDWYYVGSRWERRGWFAPEEIDREVVAVSFDGSDRVTNVERYGLEQGNVVVLSRRVTEANVKGIGFIAQLLGSVGRVSAEQVLDR
ncbi:cell envelope protein SmpA [Thioclava sp. SK-1]|uniref:outer membrane protein assembly factor BamE n=1 Tax=Thioclava sp. SK-1 TaxID=1889770 RepID=UPI0008263436|nr:outer membrane protein assembly factor BamE [Thioclava sp. SK-1]OCX60959.1 cell envelope protein SmpA [Thioclava sp. SK-1]